MFWSARPLGSVGSMSNILLRAFRAAIGVVVIAWAMSRRSISAPTGAGSRAETPAVTSLEQAEDERRTRRRLIVSVFTGLVLLGLPVLAVRWYHQAATPVEPPVSTGGLYLVVDRPNVDAGLSIGIQDPQSEHPVLNVGVRLSDSNARYALVAQGDWAFIDYPELNPATRAASAPKPGVFSAQSGAFLPTQDQPSVVVVGKQYEPTNSDESFVYGTFDVSGHLPHPVQVAGRGRERGSLPWITSSEPFGEAAITGVEGSWQRPRSASITLQVQEFGSFADHLEYSSPPASQVDYGVMWQANDTLSRVRWELTNPDSAARADEAILWIGILLGIWASVFVAVVTAALGRWVGPRESS